MKMAEDPSNSRLRTNAELRERLLEKVQLNVTETGKLGQQLLKSSRSHEVTGCWYSIFLHCSSQRKRYLQSTVHVLALGNVPLTCGLFCERGLLHHKPFWKHQAKPAMLPCYIYMSTIIFNHELGNYWLTFAVTSPAIFIQNLFNAKRKTFKEFQETAKTSCKLKIFLVKLFHNRSTIIIIYFIDFHLSDPVSDNKTVCKSGACPCKFKWGTI